LAVRSQAWSATCTDGILGRRKVDQTVQSVIDRFGRLDVLVNNAGIIEVAPLAAMTPDDFTDAHAVMFWGTLYPTLAALPHLLKRGRGRIINITSIGGKVSAPHLLPTTAPNSRPSASPRGCEPNSPAPASQSPPSFRG
jgi:NAD(P)-dependent dehydrogenase (short-subunit alcohol dehydrogenase family)